MKLELRMNPTEMIIYLKQVYLLQNKKRMKAKFDLL